MYKNIFLPIKIRTIQVVNFLIDYPFVKLEGVSLLSTPGSNENEKLARRS